MDGFAYALWCVHMCVFARMCVYAYAHSINMMPLAGCMSPSGDSRLNGQEFEQTPGDSEGQRSLACCSPGGHKEVDRT